VNTKGIEESAMGYASLFTGRYSAAAMCLSLWAGKSARLLKPLRLRPPPNRAAQSASSTKPVGNYQGDFRNTITLTTDAGTDVTVLVQEATKTPSNRTGQTDLKGAHAIQFPARSSRRPHPRPEANRPMRKNRVLAASVIAIEKRGHFPKTSTGPRRVAEARCRRLVNSVDPATS